MGKEVIKEMNRVGMVVDMSHSSERSTFEAIEISSRPIVISHANPSFWHPAKRNKSNDILKKLAEHKGMLGFSLYPHHLNNSSLCSIEDFCLMIKQLSNLIGINNIGIGSDLCNNWSDDVVMWMRNGKWTKKIDYGESLNKSALWPEQPSWFKKGSDISNIFEAMLLNNFSEEEALKILGKNWLKFMQIHF